MGGMLIYPSLETVPAEKKRGGGGGQKTKTTITNKQTNTTRFIEQGHDVRA